MRSHALETKKTQDGRDGSSFTIRAFAEATGVSMDTLRYWEKIGLLTPERRAENNFRRYGRGQLATANLLKTCRRLGVGYGQMKAYAESRTPERALALLAEQAAKMDAAVRGQIRSITLLRALAEEIRHAAAADEGAVTIERLPAKRIVLGPANDCAGGADAALSRFYRHFQTERPGADIDYPVWGVFSEERVKSGDRRCPDYFYFNNPQGMDERPAGLYAVGYARGGYGDTDALYRRVLLHIVANDCEMCGPAYEEYPLNEIAVKDPDNYLIRLLIAVRAREG